MQSHMLLLSDFIEQQLVQAIRVIMLSKETESTDIFTANKSLGYCTCVQYKKSSVTSHKERESQTY